MPGSTAKDFVGSPATGVPPSCGRPLIAAAGFRGTPTQATMVLPYLRDTGQEAWDVVAPIYISGRHWGGFRVGVSRDQIAAQSRDLLIGLGLLFSVSAVAIVGLLFWLSARYLRPLRLPFLLPKRSPGHPN